jgi:GNAT superfamily N-acetyltransferase
MTRWKIRRAQPQDAVKLAACIDAAYAPYRAYISDLPPVSEGIADDIAGHLVWVAEIDSVIAGGLVLVHGKEFATLANIAVAPDHGGQGVGRGLIERAEQYCREAGTTELRLSTHEAMPENVRLYERLGWIETGRSGSKVLMTKLL